jgi:hypothetical protein
MLQPTVQSASLSWNKAPIWGLRPDFYYCQTVAGLLMWGALSDERMGLSFAILSQSALIRLLSVCTTEYFRVRVTLRLAVYRQSVRLGAELLETHGQNFFLQLNTSGHSPYITSSLTRGWFCNLRLLLALASAFILGSESLGARDHIILSQIWDFPFLRLLRLAGSRWRYSNSPPDGWVDPKSKSKPNCDWRWVNQ